MAYRSKFVFAIISAAIAFYAISGVLFSWSNTSAQQPINDPGAQIRIFESVLQHIQNDYVDEPDLGKVRNGAMRGLAEGLDPYSSYLTAEQVTAFKANEVNKQSGVGATFSQVSSYLYVISVLKGSPAESAGLRAGDVIEYIGTKATRDISLYDAEQLVAGEAGTKVKLRVLRSRTKPLTVEITRGAVSIPEPVLSVKDGIGHLRVMSLAEGQAKKVADKLVEANEKGVSSLVLDLRNVSDGSIAEATAVANLFVKDGKLATIIGKGKKVEKTFSAEAAKHVFAGKVAALIDLGTAGTGEVVAAAILDNKRGEVVGENSFGAGVDRGLFTLSGGDGFLLTKSKWASPDGRPFLTSKRDERGVKPTVKVDRPETPDPLEVDGQVSDPEGSETPEPKKTVEPKKGPDLQLEKAFEVLRK